jgi:type IV pilus assembly protein PilP
MKHGNRVKYGMNHTFLYAAVLLIASIGFYGCDKAEPPATVKTPTKQAAPVAPGTVSTQPDEEGEKKPEQEGYVYRQRDRRDPFKPLVETSKTIIKKSGIQIGTLESYDISEFSLSAIAKKGDEYFALLIAPDNRSFTVDRGTKIGLNKGRVDEITAKKVVLLEFTKDFRGESKPRQIILEFHKGEGE